MVGVRTYFVLYVQFLYTLKQVFNSQSITPGISTNQRSSNHGAGKGSRLIRKHSRPSVLVRSLPHLSSSVSVSRAHLHAMISGPRTCIGRKFAIVEAVCWLTMVLRDWRVEPLMRPQETEEMWSRRALDARAGITLYVSDIPVRFVRRSR